MEDEYDIEELGIILGLKNKKEELNKIISPQKDLSFLGAISKILCNNNSNDLYEKDEPELDQNEMLTNFTLKVGIDKIATVKLNNYENSNFVNVIKGEDAISHTPNIHYSKEYVQKLKKDFKIKVEEEMKPIEIKQNNYDYNRKYNTKDKKYKKNEKYKDKKANQINEEQNKNEYKKEKEIEIEGKEEDKKEGDKKEEDKKEEDKKEEEKEENIEDEETEENNKGNNQEKNTGNTYRKNNRGYNNYNRRNQYNKNKGYKSKRENINAKRQYK